MADTIDLDELASRLIDLDPCIVSITGGETATMSLAGLHPTTMLDALAGGNRLGTPDLLGVVATGKAHNLDTGATPERITLVYLAHRDGRAGSFIRFADREVVGGPAEGELADQLRQLVSP